MNHNHQSGVIRHIHLIHTQTTPKGWYLLPDLQRQLYIKNNLKVKSKHTNDHSLDYFHHHQHLCRVGCEREREREREREGERERERERDIDPQKSAMPIITACNSISVLIALIYLPACHPRRSPLCSSL